MEDHLPSVVKFDVLTNKEKSLGKTVPSEIKNKVKEVGVISLSTPKVSMLVNQKGITIPSFGFYFEYSSFSGDEGD